MMFTKKFASLFYASALLMACVSFSVAQDATSQSATAQPTPDEQQQQEEKLKLEKKATALLEQVITEAQSLRLPENRIRVQIAAGDMLWDRNASRARGLFNDAGAAMTQLNVDSDRSDRPNRAEMIEAQTVNRLRQELVLTAARHDAELAYQLLRSTAPPQTNSPNNNRRMPQDNLEQNLLGAIAATDPKLAYQKAAEALDKGEFPTALSRVLNQLQTKDEESFKKLSDKALSKMTSDALLGSREATNTAMGLLFPGPRPASTSTSTATTTAAAAPVQNNGAVLNETAYHDLLDNAITAAMNTTSIISNNNVRVVGPAGGNIGGTGSPPRPMVRGQANQQNPPDEAQVRQNNARTLLMGLQAMLPQIDQYLPERSQTVRQKLTDLGINNNQAANLGAIRTAMQQNTSDSLVQAASTAPPQLQPRLYQQAAMRALDEGNPDRALQLANDHLDENARNSVNQAVELKRLATNASSEKLNEIKTKVASLPTDTERVRFLLELSRATQKDNPKLALRFLDDARSFANKRAANYRDFEDQLRVARAFGPLDSKRTIEMLEPGIAQLNELLSAAQVLNGFEVEVFKEGELSMRAGSELVNMVSRFGQELAALAKVDFDGARMTADRFQFAEPRLNAKLAIAQTVLAPQSIQTIPRPPGLPFFTR